MAPFVGSAPRSMTAWVKSLCIVTVVASSGAMAMSEPQRSRLHPDVRFALRETLLVGVAFAAGFALRSVVG